MQTAWPCGHPGEKGGGAQGSCTLGCWMWLWSAEETQRFQGFQQLVQGEKFADRNSGKQGMVSAMFIAKSRLVANTELKLVT